MSSEESLKRALKLLRSSRDERKLAGLLMVTKVLPSRASDESLDIRIVEAISDCIGIAFLKRLLRARVSLASQDEAEDYQRVALSVMSVLIASPTVARTFARNHLLPFVCDVVEKTNEFSVLQEALEIFVGCAFAGELRSVFVESSILNVLVDKVESCEGDEPLALLRALFFSWTAFDDLNESEARCIAEDILFPQSSAGATWLVRLCRLFVDGESQQKFDILELLMEVIRPFSLMYSVPTEVLQRGSSWTLLLRAGLQQIFSSRVHSRYRRLALVVSASCLSLFGSQLLESAEDSSRPNWSFVSVLWITVAVESRVLLESRVSSRANDATDSDRWLSSAAAIEACLELFDLMIEFLVSGDPMWSSLHFNEIQFVQKRLLDVVRAMTSYLRDCAQEDVFDDVLTPRVIQSLGMWIADDLESLSSDLLDLLPFLLQVCSKSENPQPPFVSIASSLANKALEDAFCEVMVENKAHVLAVRVLELVLETPNDELLFDHSAVGECSRLLRILLLKCPELAPDVGDLPSKFLPLLDRLWSKQNKMSFQHSVSLCELFHAVLVLLLVDGRANAVPDRFWSCAVEVLESVVSTSAEDRGAVGHLWMSAVQTLLAVLPDGASCFTKAHDIVSLVPAAAKECLELTTTGGKLSSKDALSLLQREHDMVRLNLEDIQDGA